MNTTFFSCVQCIKKLFSQPLLRGAKKQKDVKNNCQYQVSLLDLKKDLSRDCKFFHIFQMMNFMKEFHSHSKFFDHFRAIIFPDDEERLCDMFLDDNFLRKLICLQVVSQQVHIQELDEILKFLYKLGESLLGKKNLTHKISTLRVCFECAEYPSCTSYFWAKKVVDIRPYLSHLSRSLNFMLMEMFHNIIIGNAIFPLCKQKESSYALFDRKNIELFSQFLSVDQVSLSYLRTVPSVKKIFFFWDGVNMTDRYLSKDIYSRLTAYEQHVVSFISSQVFFQLLEEEFMMFLDETSEWLLSISRYQGDMYICVSCIQHKMVLSEYNRYIDNIIARTIHLKFSSDPQKCETLAMYCI